MTACEELPPDPGTGPGVFEELPPASREELRRTFRRHPAGVAVVTAAGSGGPVGFTVTSLVSVSADPPLVSFNIARTSSSWAAVSQARYIGIHLLGAAQEELAARFALSGADRFAAPTVWAPGPRRVPVLDGCVAWIVAAVQQRVPAGDHAIVLARVLHIGGEPDGREPLLYHDGGFHPLAAPTERRLSRLRRRQVF
ncbi:MAG TPA: flavin reductase family protein [Kineosporiaceae bacterium]|nr:flavin reductase family protein [Kineosporiaceae bacterium]